MVHVLLLPFTLHSAVSSRSSSLLHKNGINSDCASPLSYSQCFFNNTHSGYSCGVNADRLVSKFVLDKTKFQRQ